jgi:hypothetical protein
MVCYLRDGAVEEVVIAHIHGAKVGRVGQCTVHSRVFATHDRLVEVPTVLRVCVADVREREGGVGADQHGHRTTATSWPESAVTGSAVSSQQ